jgi:hypothetical protein
MLGLDLNLTSRSSLIPLSFIFLVASALFLTDTTFFTLTAETVFFQFKEPKP